jgi:hypothetical protein
MVLNTSQREAGEEPEASFQQAVSPQAKEETTEQEEDRPDVLQVSQLPQAPAVQV